MFKRIAIPFFIFSLTLISCEKEEDPDDSTETSIDINTTPAKVGDFRQGGIVFWVNSSDSTKGLVVAVDDLLASAQWGCYGTTIIGADATTLFGGIQNTADIIFYCKFVNIAADLCDEAVIDGYSDWYLPNSGEWGAIIDNLDTIEAAAAANGGKVFYDKYWTSNQPTGVVGETLARAIDIRNNHSSQERKDDRFAVRPIRAF